MPEKTSLNWIITNDFGKGKNALCLNVKLDEMYYDAFIKSDGCCEVRHYLNIGHKTQDYDQIHICDIPQFITILQSLEDFRINNTKGAE